MIVYKSILGYTCVTASTKGIKYSIELVDMFHSNFYRGNSGPVPTINLLMTMLLLEDKGDYLIFHKPCNDLINYLHLASKIQKCNNRKISSDKYKLVDLSENIIQLDKSVYTYDSSSVNHFEKYDSFTLQDILLNDIFTGEPLEDSVLTTGGFMINRSTIVNSNYCKLNTMSEYVHNPGNYIRNKFGYLFGEHFKKSNAGHSYTSKEHDNLLDIRLLDYDEIFEKTAASEGSSVEQVVEHSNDGIAT
jgi:hypothetical protein